MLIVGGGNSALEAASTLALEPGCEVTLSYRGRAFQKANPRNVVALDEAAKAGAVRVLMESTVKRVGAKDVTISYKDKEFEMPNDAIIVCAGGVLPTPMLKQLGIEVETKYGTE